MNPRVNTHACARIEGNGGGEAELEQLETVIDREVGIIERCSPG